MFNTDLTGKRALVCGSTQGIGLAAAQVLAYLGATCTLVARNPAALEAAVATLANQHEQAHGIAVADFSRSEEVRAVAAALTGEVDYHILVNNTGGPPAGPIVQAEEGDFLNAFHQHLIGNHAMAKAVLPGMARLAYGRIINVVSTSVKIPLRGLGVSNTIRGAVASWAKTLANEVAAQGITVNNVLPGATATARLSNIINNKAAKSGASIDSVSEEMVEEIPAGRFGRPEEIAAVIAFLASPAASYVTGVSIPVDGGRTGSL